MTVRWTSKALSDLVRLHEFSAQHSQLAAARLVKMLTNAAGRLPVHPRIGERLEEFAPREVRRVLVGRHELRYEVLDDGDINRIVILRLWHSGEQH
jgi:plasmid stabilization system protein ParE